MAFLGLDRTSDDTPVVDSLQPELLVYNLFL